MNNTKVETDTTKDSNNFKVCYIFADQINQPSVDQVQ